MLEGKGETMTTAQLRALLAVLDAGTFSGAALDLGVAQSSVSRSVAELERDLGVTLLRRGRRGAVPTEVGSRIAVHARRMLGLTEGIRQEAAADRGHLSGTLRVAAYPSIVRSMVAELLALFARRHPGVRLELQEAEPAEIERRLHEGIADLGFALLPAPDELITFEVNRDPYVAVVPASWPANEVRKEDFERSPVIFYGDQVCQRHIEGYFGRLGVPVAPAFRLQENATILSMVARGHGISLMPTSAARGDEPVRRLPLPVPLDRVTGVALRPERLPFPVVKEFLKLLREQERIDPTAGREPVLTGG